MSFGGGSKKTEVSTESDPWGPTQGLLLGGTYGSGKQEFKDWLNQQLSPGTGLFGRAITEAGTDRPFFPGQTYAGFDPLQEEAQAGLTGYARGALPEQIGQYQQGLMGMMDAPNQLMQNPALQGLMEANRKEAMGLMNTQNRGAIAAGQLGGSRQGIAQANVAGELADANSRAAASFFSPLMRGQTAAAQLMPGAAKLGAMPSTLLSEVGGQRQAMDQLGINEAMARYQHPQQEAMRQMALLEGASGIGGQYGSGQTSTRAPGSSTFANIAGIGLGLAGLGQNTLGGGLLGNWFGGGGGSGGGSLVGPWADYA